MSSSSASTSKVASLLDSARKEGALSKQSAHLLNVDDIGDQINTGLGVPAINVEASEVTLVSLLIDDSGSIEDRDNSDAIRMGHNELLAALAESKQGEGVQIACRYLNGFQLYDYRPLSGAIAMDKRNYHPDGGTPLYDQSIVFLGTILAKTQEFIDIGVPARSVSIIVSDGADLGSRRTAANNKSIVTDLRRRENQVIAFMGVDDGSTDFRAIARSMGIEDKWILTPGNTRSEIRKAFGMFSKSAVKMSQAANFSAAAAGGFGG